MLALRIRMAGGGAVRTGKVRHLAEDSAVHNVPADMPVERPMSQQGEVWRLMWTSIIAWGW